MCPGLHQVPENMPFIGIPSEQEFHRKTHGWLRLKISLYAHLEDIWNRFGSTEHLLGSDGSLNRRRNSSSLSRHSSSTVISATKNLLQNAIHIYAIDASAFRATRQDLMITGALDPSQPDLLTYAGLNGRVGRFTSYRRRTAFPSLGVMSEVHGVMSIPTSKRKGCIWQAVVIPMVEPPAQ